jgi:hypothetical protein
MALPEAIALPEAMALDDGMAAEVAGADPAAPEPAAAGALEAAAPALEAAGVDDELHAATVSAAAMAAPATTARRLVNKVLDMGWVFPL